MVKKLIGLVGLLVGGVGFAVVRKSDGMPGRASNDTGDLYPPFRTKVDALFRDLVGLGFTPSIRETWRSPDRQAYYVKMKWSEVSKSFHTVTADDGTPESLAIDCHDARYDPDADAQAAFYRSLLQLAPKYGLVTGGTFSRRGKWAAHGLGWDPGHVQPASISIAAAHRGERPWR